MDWLLNFILCCLLVQMSVAHPVIKDKPNEEHKDTDNNVEEMEYHRYLKEVIEALESDPNFLSKLKAAKESDIQTGKIANELECVDYKIRSRLDELKRNELERLRHLVAKENQLNNMDLKHSKMAQHLDHSNTHSFEIDDLKKLIAKTTEDLAEADRRRRQKFKEYEMQKKFLQEQKMNAMDEDEKKKYAQQLEEIKEKHKKHEPLHHPGSKQQLKEVWETQDHMDEDDFDLHKFFYIHDIDGNGVWDQNEVKALFLKDLDKLYDKNAPEDDLLEREEEMERMREHLFNEADLNKDGVISLEEFLIQSTKVENEQDQGWKTLEDQRIFTQEEYEAFQKRIGEKEALIGKGMPPQHQDNVPHNQQYPPQHGNIRTANQQQYHPQQIQIPIQQQVPMQQQVPIQQQQQQYNQIPQQQYQPQMMPQGGQFHGQVQLQSNQIPVQQAQVQHQQQQQQQQQQMQQQQLQQQQLQYQQQQRQQQQYQNQQQFQHPNVQAQIPQQQNVPNQIPQQQNIPSQQQPAQNQTPQQQNLGAQQNNQNNIVQQQNQQPIQNSAQHIQENSVHSSGKV